MIDQNEQTACTHPRVLIGNWYGPSAIYKPTNKLANAVLARLVQLLIRWTKNNNKNPYF